MTEPFIRAVIEGDLVAVAAQLSGGRDPNIPDQYGWIPLHRASANNRADIARLLIEAGSSLQKRGTDGWTPLHLAAVSGSADVVSVLIAAGAELNSVSDFGDTALHLCVTSRSVEVARRLLSAGALSGLTNVSGLTAFAKAESNGVGPLVELLKAGV